MDSGSETTPPDYLGGSLVNLVAELEWRMTTTASAPRLHEQLAANIPPADTYVFMLLDGLGSHQLNHRAAGSISTSQRGTIDAPFPSTTTVSLATIATGLPPRQHGLLGHVIWSPELRTTINALRWTGRDGKSVDTDTTGYLPAPNLWERLSAAGIEPITVQPGQFIRSPLSKATYRGCRFEPIWNTDELVQAVVDLSRVERRFIFAYLPQVDFAAHLYGQNSAEYADALQIVETTWDHLAARLPPGVAMIGTADHGHIDYQPDDKHLIDSVDGLTLFGDPRALYVRGDADRIEALGARLPARWVGIDDLRDWWGPSDPGGGSFAAREPDGVFLADEGRLLIPGHMDKRLIGYHGGLDPRELKIPLLVAENS